MIINENKKDPTGLDLGLLGLSLRYATAEVRLGLAIGKSNCINLFHQPIWLIQCLSSYCEQNPHVLAQFFLMYDLKFGLVHAPKLLKSLHVLTSTMSLQPLGEPVVTVTFSVVSGGTAVPAPQNLQENWQRVFMKYCSFFSLHLPWRARSEHEVWRS